VKTELDKLIELQKTDSNIRRLTTAINTAEERRAKLEKEFEKHASSILEIQNKHADARAARAETEAKISENQMYLERAQRNLKNAQGQKEYETAMRETDNLQKQISKLETEALEKMTEIEEMDKVLAERADEINSLEGDKKKAFKEFDANIKENKAELESETKKREEVFTTVSPKLARIYDRFSKRSRDGVAVAEVIKGSCSACFMSLRPQMLLKLRTTSDIITCESCTRILFLPQTESHAAEG
jgi:uncharacterized protein